MNTDCRSAVCTVFQGNYHYGLGAFANSLYRAGYRGCIYAGYKGELPPWVDSSSADANQVAEHPVGEGLYIRFVPQLQDEMLANIKPALIEQVWDHFGDRIDYVFYFDCDIVVKSKWKHFEDWARFGVALCEDMNSPVSKTHPLRKQWQQYFAKFGIDYQPKDRIYVNGGFLGLHRQYRDFVNIWDEIQVHMKKETGKQVKIGIMDRWNLFHFMDQDALNVAKDLFPALSIMGMDAMDFGKSGYVMSHAAGRSKPWQKTYLKNLFRTGARPGLADKRYWDSVDGPIGLFSPATVRRKRLAIRLTTFLSRFFTRT